MMKCKDCKNRVWNEITKSYDCSLPAKDYANCPNLIDSIFTPKEEIVDELCKCRHLRSEHNDTFSKGHGDCTKCECEKFTWISFLYSDVK